MTAVKRRARTTDRTYNTLVIGAGFLGLGTAARLRAAGVTDVVVVERADRVGGTWRDNTYPGIACDIPSMLYSYSFAQNPSWSKSYSPGAEICAHIEAFTDDHGLRELIHFNTTVEALAWDETAGVWDVTTSTGMYRARSVVAASGPLSDASFPTIRGLETYQGHKILSARWDHDYDFAGKDVAVIGTGATAVQIVPELVKTAGSVKVFQRTPGWVLPRLDVDIPAPVRALFGRVPLTQDIVRKALFAGHETSAVGMVWDTPVTTVIQRLATAHLRHQVKDPWLRRQLTPDFRAGCKRMLMSSDWYPALQADNCKLITWPIAQLSEKGIRTSDGVEHAFDAIVFATGYDVHLDGPPYPVTGVGGRSLSAEWAGHAEAFKSASVHGYPNLFFTTGPNSGPGHNSLLVYAEGQIDYAVRAIRTILDEDLKSLDVRESVQRRYNERLQRRLTRTTWMSGCSSWYLTADGYNASMFPGFATQYLRQMRSFRRSDYELTVANRAAAPVTG